MAHPQDYATDAREAGLADVMAIAMAVAWRALLQSTYSSESMARGRVP